MEKKRKEKREKRKEKEKKEKRKKGRGRFGVNLFFVFTCVNKTLSTIFFLNQCSYKH